MNINKLSCFSFSLFLLILAIPLNSCHENPDKQNHTNEEDSIEPNLTREVDLDFLMGKFDPAEHPEFIEIDTIYADRSGLLLQKKCFEAFRQMHAAALKDGVKLIIRSATRNFYSQKAIWEDKWNGKRTLSDGTNASKDITDPVERALKILEYSSMPGTSRHHWGSDIDLNAFENSWFEAGEGKKLYDWMLENAAVYGFYQPYTEKDEHRPNGYNEEKWHWSYKPLSSVYVQNAVKSISDEMIKGFDGSETAVSIGVKEKYILGINQECF